MLSWSITEDGQMNVYPTVYVALYQTVSTGDNFVEHLSSTWEKCNLMDLYWVWSPKFVCMYFLQFVTDADIYLPHISKQNCR